MATRTTPLSPATTSNLATDPPPSTPHRHSTAVSSSAAPPPPTPIPPHQSIGAPPPASTPSTPPPRRPAPFPPATQDPHRITPHRLLRTPAASPSSPSSKSITTPEYPQNQMPSVARQFSCPSSDNVAHRRSRHPGHPGKSHHRCHRRPPKFRASRLNQPDSAPWQDVTLHDPT